MIRRIITLFFILLFTSVLVAPNVIAQGDVDWEIQSCTAASLTAKYPGLKGTLDKPKDFFSNSVGDTVGYAIYLPPSYNTNVTKRYPVVYFLHGMAGNECNYFGNSEDSSAHSSNNDIVDLVERGDIPETIFISINGGRGLSYADFIESMFINEFIPHIDNKYRTIPNKNGRSLEGFSMGGYGTAKFIFKHPNTFCAGTIMAGADITNEMESFLWSNESNIVTSNLLIKGVVGNDQTTLDMEDLFNNDLVQFANENGFSYSSRIQYVKLNAAHNVKQLLDSEGLKNAQRYWTCFSGTSPSITPSISPSITPTGGATKSADVDNDGDVDIVDRLKVLYLFFTNGSKPEDINNSRFVDIFDFNQLIKSF